MSGQELLLEEIVEAEEDIRQEQFKAFSEEYNALKKGKPIHPTNPLTKFYQESMITRNSSQRATKVCRASSTRCEIS